MANVGHQFTRLGLGMRLIWIQKAPSPHQLTQIVTITTIDTYHSLTTLSTLRSTKSRRPVRLDHRALESIRQQVHRQHTNSSNKEISQSRHLKFHLNGMEAIIGDIVGLLAKITLTFKGLTAN